MIVPTNPSNPSPAWPSDYPVSDDYAVVNEGQLKNFATQAYVQMQAVLPSSVWSTSDGTALTSEVTGWSTTTGDDYLVMNLGQAKTVANYFYKVLQDEGYTAGPPWTGTGADDYAAANIGQLKHLFDLDVVAPVAPTNLEVGYSGTQATISWSEAFPLVNTYTVEYSLNGTTWTPATPISATATSVTLTGFTLGANYSFRVLATNAVGSSPTSTSDAAPTIALVTPSGVTLVP